MGLVIFLFNLVQYWTAAPPESAYHSNIKSKPELGKSIGSLDPEDVGKNLNLEVKYALDNMRCSCCSVVVGHGRRRRRLIDSRTASDCGDSVDLQPGQRSPSVGLSQLTHSIVIRVCGVSDIGSRRDMVAYGGGDIGNIRGLLGSSSTPYRSGI